MLRSENNSDNNELAQLLQEMQSQKESAGMTMNYELVLIFEDKEFAHWYTKLGQPAESPAQLALVKGATLGPRPGVKMIVQRRIGKEQL